MIDAWQRRPESEGSVEPRIFPYHRNHNIAVFVRPVFLPDQSRPSQQQFVFAYFIRIENMGVRTVQLLSRRWLIHDGIGSDEEVVGDGVVGQQPILPPGHAHEYNSFCILRSPTGYMDGSYCFIGPDDVMFDVAIPRFYLSASDLPQITM